MHDKPQIGHEPLEEHPEPDKYRIHVQGEAVEALYRLQSVFVARIIRFQVHRGHWGLNQG